jgi:hypothetical protein
MKMIAALFALISLAGCAQFNADYAKAKTDIAKVDAKIVTACRQAVPATAAVSGALDPTSQTGQVAGNVAGAVSTICAAANAVAAGN